MYYCFLEEDIERLTNDPLVIQKEYARRLGSLYVGSLKQQAIFDISGSKVSLAGKRVLLRCTYDNLIRGICLLNKQGAKLIETESDIDRIESWYKLGLTNRTIREVELPELLAMSGHSGIADKVLLKSKHKGFSAVISMLRIVQRESKTIAFLEEQSQKYGSMLLSKYIPIRTDSLGVRETRHVVINNQIVTSSRPIHSLKHTVPKSHKIKALQIVERIKHLGEFPSNYMLDLGEFMDDYGNADIDIVEINPLSCSMCYVNNSIYTIEVPEINECRQQLMMGFEFCYDAIVNPQNYSMTRASNKSYSYISDSQYYFL